MARPPACAIAIRRSPDPSFRGARKREPGIQTFDALPRVLDSGFAAARRPGMTAGHRRNIIRPGNVREHHHDRDRRGVRAQDAGGRAARLRRHAAADQGDLHRLGRQSRRMVRLLRLCGVRALFRRGVLPQRRPGGAAAQRRAPVRGRLPGAAAGRLAVRPSRRSLRAAQRADALGAADVLRLADDRRHADLRDDRHRGAARARRSPASSRG